MNKESFARLLEEQGLSLDSNQLSQFETYLHLIQEWNEKMNLTAITEDSGIWEKHFYDSIVPFLHTPFETLCDVGSGAGFPGIPLAIAWPQRQFTLVEPLQKRCRFLNEVISVLHLHNVQVVNARAEDYAATHRAEFDAVSARAVARLSILLELCIPLLKDDGTFIALKGANAHEELANAAPALKALHVRLEREEKFELGNEGSRINFYFVKTAPTPAKYPRAYGTIKKKPLEVSNG